VRGDEQDLKRYSRWKKMVLRIVVQKEGSLEGMKNEGVPII